MILLVESEHAEMVWDNKDIIQKALITMGG